ncbi:MAG: hypothetical protein ACO3RB_02920 [Ilumatobacteraceae bacterium]
MASAVVAAVGIGLDVSAVLGAESTLVVSVSVVPGEPASEDVVLTEVVSPEQAASAMIAAAVTRARRITRA